ncbi:conserved hypothetical protein [Neospora caninum Liverpool]|uniref:Uncharacterized protein n=1 Tax=Neospora caninum (strain Liverpool) TaxID=572307 RepID=F0VQ57_NEOCL|nr:conserved hypothetical protein [Neospora caninum Liverpool]CBZ55854.1 conserved hypothetical protein [Neospora caninum Liverpool]CEL70598.1 TPA: hypothetical protein BN1204_062800 [Neospora caninum Liverpool]|eukprot:XP_003885880.1 conserved hypothetical protein [Neospora caninum Liverpool]
MCIAFNRVSDTWGAESHSFYLLTKRLRPLGIMACSLSLPDAASFPALAATSMNPTNAEPERSLTFSRKNRRQEKPTVNTVLEVSRASPTTRAVAASALSLTKSPLARPALRPYEILVTRRLPLVVYFKRCMRLLHAGLEPSQQKRTSTFLNGTKDAQFQKQLVPQFPFIIIRGAGGCMRTAIWLAQDVVKALGGLVRSAEERTSCRDGASTASSYSPSLEVETHTVECTDTAWTFAEDDDCSVVGAFDLAVRRRSISAISIKVYRPLLQELS